MVLSIGEVLLRLSTVSAQKLEQASLLEAHWGGSEANVLINLSLVGIKGRFLTRLPDSPLGTAAIRKLQGYGLDTTHVARGGARMGLYFLEQGTSLRAGKVVYDRAHASVNEMTSDDFSWDNVFKDITWVHWSGITPALSENTAGVCAAMINEAANRNIPVSCDLHSRSTLWNYGKAPAEVLPPLLEKTQYLVGDPFAIGAISGDEPGRTTHLDDKALFASFDKALTRFPSLRIIAMLSREVINASENIIHGVLFNGEGYSSPAFHVRPITDRIGSGDAFTSGLIHGLLTGMGEKELIQWAAALAACKHTIPGDQLDGSIEDFRAFAQGEYGKIRR